MTLSKREWKKLIPHLMKELEGKRSIVGIRSVRTSTEGGEGAVSHDKLQGYIPDAVDFIRRCAKEEQALEIIEFLRKRGRISSPYAEKLKEQLRTKGLRSFGPKKRRGYYFRIAGRTT